VTRNRDSEVINRYRTYCIDPPSLVHAANEAEGVTTVVTVTLQIRSANVGDWISPMWQGLRFFAGDGRVSGGNHVLCSGLGRRRCCYGD